MKKISLVLLALLSLLLIVSCAEKDVYGRATVGTTTATFKGCIAAVSDDEIYVQLSEEPVDGYEGSETAWQIIFKEQYDGQGDTVNEGFAICRFPESINNLLPSSASDNFLTSCESTTLNYSTIKEGDNIVGLKVNITGKFTEGPEFSIEYDGPVTYAEE